MAGVSHAQQFLAPVFLHGRDIVKNVDKFQSSSHLLTYKCLQFMAVF